MSISAETLIILRKVVVKFPIASQLPFNASYASLAQILGKVIHILVIL